MPSFQDVAKPAAADTDRSTPIFMRRSQYMKRFPERRRAVVSDAHCGVPRSLDMSKMVPSIKTSIDMWWERAQGLIPKNKTVEGLKDLLSDEETRPLYDSRKLLIQQFDMEEISTADTIPPLTEEIDVPDIEENDTAGRMTFMDVIQQWRSSSDTFEKTRERDTSSRWLDPVSERNTRARELTRVNCGSRYYISCHTVATPPSSEESCEPLFSSESILVSTGMDYDPDFSEEPGEEELIMQSIDAELLSLEPVLLPMSIDPALLSLEAVRVQFDIIDPVVLPLALKQ